MGKRWAEVKPILEAVQDLSGAELEAVLDRECASDDELRQEVEAYLEADTDQVGFLEKPPLSLGDEEEPDDRIGSYQVVRELGRGATGVVYLATRVDGEFDHQVAVKVLTRTDADEIVWRFRMERQILANLDHPWITKLLDGASTADGRPYFVMEYVEGLPIDQYCAQNRLGLAHRLRLFQKVCSAVHFAHQHEVIHRDLKPSNILVDARGEPRLLDFGIAKILEPRRSASTPSTLYTTPLTPEYASPEQAGGRVTTTASDVYSLGVVLYKLLTGMYPYDLKSRAEYRDVICEVQPDNPSISRNPVGEFRDFQKRLAGDLDAIVLTTLRKDPQLRYSSAEALFEDLGRYLQNKPIRAQRGTFLYRARKFVRRNRPGVAAAALVFLVICASGFALFRQYHQTVRERHKFQEVSEMLKGIFESADPFKSKPEAVTAKELLDNGARRIERTPPTDPVIRAAMQQTIADSYLNLGIFEPAEQLAQSAMELRKELHGPDHPAVAESQRTLALVVADKGDLDFAEKLLQASLKTRRRYLGGNHPDVATTLSGLGFVRFSQAKYEEAERFHEEALGIRQRAYGSVHEDIAENLNFLGLIYKEQQRYTEAEAAFLESLDICRSVFGKEHSQVAIRLHNLGLLYREQERFEEAETCHREALRTLERSLGPKHFAVATTVNMLALFLQKHDRYDEALSLQIRALALRQELFGDEHYSTATSLNNLGVLYFEMGRLAESEEPLREAVRIRKTVLRPNHPSLANSLVSLGKTLLAQEQYEEARASFEQGIAIHESESHPRLPRSLRAYAELFRAMDDEERALEIEDRATVLEEGK